MSLESILNTLTIKPGDEDAYHITINEGAFRGTTYKYGRIWFPDDNEPIMSFDYDVISDPKPVFKEQFEQLIGEILHEMLKKSIEERTTVYTGGVGESITE